MAALLQRKKQIEKKGRGGDRLIAHVSPGEIVIPRAFAEDYEFRTVLNQFFKENDADLRKFIVGDSKNNVNPKTGYLEFGLFSDIAKPFKKVFKEVGRIEKQIFGKVGKELRRVEQKVEGAVKGIFIPQLPKIIPPELPPPVATPRQISEQAQRVSGAERRRIKGRRGRLGTIFAGRRDLAPALVSRAELKTTFG